LAKWEEAVTPTVWGKWVKDNEARGYKNAQQILDDAIEMLKARRQINNILRGIPVNRLQKVIESLYKG
jgi:predicted GNAT family N-acyltransferase